MHTFLNVLAVAVAWTAAGLAVWSLVVGFQLRFEVVGERAPAEEAEAVGTR